MVSAPWFGLGQVAADRALETARSQQDVERAEDEIKRAIARIREVSTLQEPPQPSQAVDDAELPDKYQMFWTSPGQLMEIFGQLEEQNLFLIQNAQETEEALEELKAKFVETRERMEGESTALQQQIEALREAITVETEKARLHRDKAVDGTMRLKARLVRVMTSILPGGRGVHEPGLPPPRCGAAGPAYTGPTPSDDRPAVPCLRLCRGLSATSP